MFQRRRFCSLVPLVLPTFSLALVKILRMYFKPYQPTVGVQKCNEAHAKILCSRVSGKP